jgi:hypothetical protein
LLLVVSAAAWFFYSSGYLLYYGDAQAHLDNSRSWIDSRTPGYDQIGTVWLPILHLICLPFVGNNFLWSSGLAGTIPVAACFVIAGACLYFCGKEAYGSSGAAAVVLLCFALNPNVLYLATITMTELVFAAGLSVCLLSLLRFRRTQNFTYVALAIGASWWMSLTRYDGWFLIPFISLALANSAKTGKLRLFIVVGTFAALVPIYWAAHNWWETGNALDFYNGPYSAAAIQKYQTYPGFHDWPAAIHYYWEAGRACSGMGLLVLGVAGFCVAIWKRRWQAVAFLSLTPLFYVWSVHSSWTPIHLPWLWPHGYYNSRYGLAVVVLLAFSAGALATLAPRKSWLIPLLAVLSWVIRPNTDNWICWKESQRNSDSRRAWTDQAAVYFADHYRSGDGVLTEFGDLAGVFCKARLPLKEVLHEGNGPAWFVNTLPSGLVRQTKWAMAQEGDKLSQRLADARSYQVVQTIRVNGAPPLLIYQRLYLGDRD